MIMEISILINQASAVSLMIAEEGQEIG